MKQTTSQAKLVDVEAYVLDQKYRIYDGYVLSNNQLDEKASRIVQTGGIIIGFGTIASVLKEWPGWPHQLVDLIPLFPTFLMIMCFAIYIFIVYMWLRFTRPTPKLSPGDTDWDLIRECYLVNDRYFEQLISDLLNAIDSADEENRDKAGQVDFLIKLLLAQTTAFALAWLAPLFV